MAGFETAKSGLAALNAKVVAASADSIENARVVAAELSFPVAFGVTRSDGEKIGAWWGEQRGGIIQPAEFVINQDGKVVSSTYSSGPIGRVDAADVVKLLNFYESRK